MNVDLSKNPKQEEFFNTAIASAYGLNDYRNLFYGGAIRGGKTFVCLTILTFLAKHFQGFRAHIIRQDFPALSGTTIPSMEKILAGSSNWRWNRDKSNYFAYHIKSDSKIFFKGENISHDPDLNDFLGLETNAILFEQIEEISEKTYDIARSRNGSWYIDKMPKPINLATFNPTQKWVKKKIYEIWKDGKLKAPDYFQQAFPEDNAFVTEDQWSAWGNLADRYQRQMIKGDWTDFSDNSRWAFAFSREKHLGEPVPNNEQYLYLSFDFNRNPICCSVIQWYDKKIRVLETIKIPNSDIYQLCAQIKVKYPSFLYFISGDASGSNQSAMVKDNLNYYIIIKQELNISDNQINVPSANPLLADNQVLVNSLLQNYSIEIHKEKAEPLIYDLENVKMLADGSILKANREDPTQQADALDTFRYFCNTFLRDFIITYKTPESTQEMTIENDFDFNSIK